MKIRNMKKMTKVVLALCATVGLGGCGDLTVPDLNNPSVESLEDRPRRARPSSTRPPACSSGTARARATQNGYVSHAGRARPRVVRAGRRRTPATSARCCRARAGPGSPAFGGNFWTNPYVNIRNANTLLNALDKVTGVSEAEKAGHPGLTPRRSRRWTSWSSSTPGTTNGAPIDVNRPLGGELAPIEGKEEVLAHIATLLDEGKAHLEAGGDSFPFPLSSGFVEFDDPSTKKPPMSVKPSSSFNRAVKARVDVYRKDWNQALTDLGESFIDDHRARSTGACTTPSAPARVT